MQKKIPGSILFAVFIMAWASRVFAHPHVFVDTAVIVYVDDGQVIALEPIWIFDELYSQTMAEYDGDGDGVVSTEELQVFAQTAFQNLEEWNYFTVISEEKKAGRLNIVASNPLAVIQSGRLIFRFRLTPERPLEGLTSIQMFDPSYFIAMEFVSSEQLVTFLPVNFLRKDSVVASDQERREALSKGEEGCTFEVKDAVGADEELELQLSSLSREEKPDNPNVGSLFAKTLTFGCY